MNGTLTPPAPSQTPDSSTGPKRKRDESEVTAQVNGVAASAAPEQTTTEPELSIDAQLAADVHTILKRFDPEPSILEYPLAQADERRLSNGEPSPKRAKVDEVSAPSTIAQKLEKQEYKTLVELSQDVRRVADRLLGPIAAKQYASDNKTRASRQLSEDEVQLFTKANALKKEVERLVSAQEADASASKVRVKREEAVEEKLETVDGAERTLLTLFANAPGPRQLYSSFQIQKKVAASGAASSQFEHSVGVELSIDDRELPNILSKVELAPHKVGRTSEKARTLIETFPPPANVLPLTPPKPAKQLTTRGSSVSFVSQDALSRMPRRASYNWVREPLPVGQWLGYDGLDSTQELTSPEAKRRKRDRALSTGEANPPLSEEAVLSLQQAREEALFRSVYSSFAPSRDDSGAVIPSQVKSDIWWQKFGKQMFEPSGDVEQPELNGAEAAPQSDDEIDEGRLTELLEEYDPAEDQDYVQRKLGMVSKKEKEVEEILSEISELLETLYSFQRIRHSSLASNARTPVNHNSSLTSLTGSPSTPTAAETAIYEALRSQLSVMVGSLPPYAVAKLNGDQLDELNISRCLVFEAANPRGVVEEPLRPAPRSTKTPSYASAPVGTPVNRGPVSGHHYTPIPAGYGRTPVSQNTHVRPAANYYPQQAAAAARTPLAQFQRAAGNSQAFQTPGTFPQVRPVGYAQNYSQTAVRPNYGPAGVQNYAPAIQQRPPMNQYYQNSPIQNRQYNAQVQPVPHVPRPSSAASMHNPSASQSPYMRNASPLKPAPTQPIYSQPNHGYGAPAPVTTGPMSHPSNRPMGLTMPPHQQRPSSAGSYQQRPTPPSASQSPRVSMAAVPSHDQTRMHENHMAMQNSPPQMTKPMQQPQQPQQPQPPENLAVANTTANANMGQPPPRPETATPPVKQGSQTPQPQFQPQPAAVGGDATGGAAQVNGTGHSAQ